MFAALLKDLYLQSGVSAMNVCLLSYWASLAGMRGEAKEWGLPPGKQTGKYSQHLRKKLGLDQDVDGDVYSLKVPGHSKHDASRVEVDLTCFVPHEALAAELQEDETILERARQEHTAEAWWPTFCRHPVVLGSGGDPVIPLSMYMDGVRYSQSDSVIGIWFYNLLTKNRRLCLVVRKACLCHCGCQSWCTMRGIMSFLRWSLQCMAEGQWPSARHDSEAWGSRDHSRAAFASKPLGFRGALVQLKADWSEMCNSLGFPNGTLLCGPVCSAVVLRGTCKTFPTSTCVVTDLG